jgi:hypothetical protein
MSNRTPNRWISSIASGLLLLVFLTVAAALVLMAAVAIDIIDEGLMHSLTIFESEPKEGWDYHRWKAIKEALPSWILCGAVWSSLTGLMLYFAFRNARRLFAGHHKL